MLDIIKYEECTGGGHILLTVSEDGIERLQVFDKSQLFDSQKIDPVYVELISKIATVAPSATKAEDVDWLAVKAAVEYK